MTERRCENCEWWTGKKGRDPYGISEAQGYDKKWKDVDNRQRACVKSPSLPMRLWNDWCGDFKKKESK